MEKKIYQQPSIKVLENAIKLLFDPDGAGVSEATPDTPGVNPAKESMDDDNEGFGYQPYSVWED